MAKLIISILRSVKIEIDRLVDHTYRMFSGLPAQNRSEITPQLFVGGQYSRTGLISLKERGFTTIVNLRMKSFEDQAIQNGFHYLHLPTIDQTPVSLLHLKVGSKFIQNEINNGGKVYIHCRAGEGRGPTMAIGYLISTGLHFEEAFVQVRTARSFIKPTSGQIENLKRFESQTT